jgi:beta-glucosidase
VSHIDRLGELTRDEKVALLDGADLWRTKAIERVGIPAARMSDGPHGLRVQFEEGDHLGVEGSDPATCFPPAVAIASSWNERLARRVGAALGDEARAAGVDLLLGPGINLKRTPLCGRNFEYYSEDPVLTGELSAALIEGLQSKGVGAAIKHFAANNQETERMSISVEVDERTLRELYLHGFERAIMRAKPWAVMCSYNRINGVFASEDPWLLTQVLRDEWGFEGMVVSDWGAVSRRDRGIAAGLDLEMPSSSGAGTQSILGSLASGDLDEAEVDGAVSRVLQLVDRAQAGRSLSTGLDLEAQHRVAYEAALEGAVLLENDGVLPLDAAFGGAIAVIGEFARTPRYQGAGSSQVAAIRVDAALDGIRALVGDAREVRFAPGYRIEASDEESARRLRSDAVDAVRGAEVAVLFLGLPPSYESESFDRSHLRLPEEQLTLLNNVAALGVPLVVVLSNGGVVEIAEWRHQASAVLEGWLLGEAGGTALADLLFGVASPSGRLAETIPVKLEHTPAVGNFPGEHGVVRYGERGLVGYRWYDAHGLDVAYPFGFGLGYSTFAWSGVALALDAPSAHASISVTVRNTGSRTASEVVQLYVADLESSVAQPPRRLAGFAKIRLEPGEERRVTVALDRRAFAYWHTGAGRWVVEGGTFEVHVARHSRDVVETVRFELPGDAVEAELTLDSPAGDWWNHAMVGERVRAATTGRYGRLLGDPNEAPLYRPIPLSRMMRFPGFPFGEDLARGWLDEVHGRQAAEAT